MKLYLRLVEFAFDTNTPSNSNFLKFHRSSANIRYQCIMQHFLCLVIFCGVLSFQSFRIHFVAKHAKRMYYQRGNDVKSNPCDPKCRFPNSERMKKIFIALTYVTEISFSLHTVDHEHEILNNINLQTFGYIYIYVEG